MARASATAAALACLAAFLVAAPRAARAAGPGAQVLEDFKRGLREDATEARAAAVDRLAAGASALSEEQRRSAAKLLRKAFETDGNAALRVSEVKALAALRDEASWVTVLLAAIKDRQPEVARAARLSLLRGREDLLDVVRKLLREDQDPTFRADLLLLAGWRRKRDAVPLLLDALSDPHPRAAAAAAEALEAVTGKALGLDPAAWRAWAAAAGAPAPVAYTHRTRPPN